MIPASLDKDVLDRIIQSYGRFLFGLCTNNRFGLVILTKMPMRILIDYNPFNLLKQGLGITVFGIAYMFVHDGLVHKRFQVGPIADIPYFRRVAAAHQVKFYRRIRINLGSFTYIYCISYIIRSSQPKYGPSICCR